MFAVRVISVMLMLIAAIPGSAQQRSKTKIFTGDIAIFWKAYDRVVATRDTATQVQLIQKYYIDLAHEGLDDLIHMRNMKAKNWVTSINAVPAFWESVRNKTLAIPSQTGTIDAIMKRYKALYPAFQQPAVYFTIGVLKTGGVTRRDRILIGTEIIAADSTVNTTGLSAFLRETFRLNQGIRYLVAHEACHTQQKGLDENVDTVSDLLGYCLREGACDLLTELVLQKPLKTAYSVYGQQHEAELWKKFKVEMSDTKTDEWLYNSGAAQKGMADLGYYMGYVICKAYYTQAQNKTQALAEIVELDFANIKSLHDFLDRSGYARAMDQKAKP